jgi:hypothetical protein
LDVKLNYIGRCLGRAWTLALANGGGHTFIMGNVDDEFSEEQLCGALTRLVDGWTMARGDARSFSSRAHPARVSVVYALTAHTHRLARATLCLLEAGFKAEALPNIRAAYESALAISWITQIDDGLPAYLNRNHNHQILLRNSASAAGWAAGQHRIPADDLSAFLVSGQSTQGARSTEKLCEDFFFSEGMYAIYRLLSGMAHPSAHIADLYLVLREADQVPLLGTEPNYENDRMFIVGYLHILCSSLVWSARALNLIDSERANSDERQRLRGMAAELKIPEFLVVTPEAKFRGEKAERSRVRTEQQYPAP